MHAVVVVINYMIYEYIAELNLDFALIRRVLYKLYYMFGFNLSEVYKYTQIGDRILPGRACACMCTHCFSNPCQCS